MQPALHERRREMPEDPPHSRELGRVRGVAPGPTLIVVAGVHGNEHAGTVGARRVIESLRRDRAGHGLNFYRLYTYSAKSEGGQV